MKGLPAQIIISELRALLKAKKTPTDGSKVHRAFPQGAQFRKAERCLSTSDSGMGPLGVPDLVGGGYLVDEAVDESMVADERIGTVDEVASVDEVVRDAKVVDDLDAVPGGRAVAVPTGSILHNSAPAKVSGGARTIFEVRDKSGIIQDRVVGATCLICC